MINFKIHTLESAPEKSKPALEGLKKAVGIIPNLAATMAESPTLINGFVGAFGNFHGSTFTGAEKQVLLATNAVTNKSAWAVAFHSTLALKEGVDPKDVNAIRQQELPRDKRYAALSRLTRTLIEKRGALNEVDQNEFLSAGFKPEQMLEVIAGIAVSTMANYAGNITNPALEEPFLAQKWVNEG